MTQVFETDAAVTNPQLDQIIARLSGNAPSNLGVVQSDLKDFIATLTAARDKQATLLDTANKTTPEFFKAVALLEKIVTTLETLKQASSAVYKLQTTAIKIAERVWKQTKKLQTAIESNP